MMRIYWIVVITLLSGVFSAAALAHGINEEARSAMIAGDFWDYVHLGADHMLSGYDHLLFLFGVMFFLTRFLDVIKIITAFTIGHSITLIFATLYGIQANPYAVDAVIALTVMYKAFENLDGFDRYWGIKTPDLLPVVFGIGLIHGFGLSTRLQQVPLDESTLMTDIIGFNIGVELGQVMALSVMYLALMVWRKRESFKAYTVKINWILFSLGAYLLIVQYHSYLHTSHPHEFPMNEKHHLEFHEKQSIESDSIDSLNN